jgi:hypothetical protein
MNTPKMTRYLERVSKNGFPCFLCSRRGGALKVFAASSEPGVLPSPGLGNYLHADASHPNESDVHKPCSTEPLETVKAKPAHRPDQVRIAHVACLYWLMATPVEGETIAACVQRTIHDLERQSFTSLAQQMREHATDRCVVCKRRGVGLCLRCAAPGCDVAYHVTCAQQAYLWMDTATRQSMCPKHTRLRLLSTSDTSVLQPTPGHTLAEAPPKRPRGRPPRIDTQAKHLEIVASSTSAKASNQTIVQEMPSSALRGMISTNPMEAGTCYRNLRECRRAMERLRTLADLVWRREMAKLGHTEIFFKYVKRMVVAETGHDNPLMFSALAGTKQGLATAPLPFEPRRNGSSVRSPKRRRGSSGKHEGSGLHRDALSPLAVESARSSTSRAAANKENAHGHPTDPPRALTTAKSAAVQPSIPNRPVPTSLRLSGFVGSALRVAGAAFRFSRGNGRQGT